MYCGKHDAYYDAEGNWLEPPCGATECWFDCANRPEKHPDDCDGPDEDLDP